MSARQQTSQPEAGVTLAILAGGEGSRMGRPKGLLEFLGAPILEWILNNVNWPGPTLLVTAPGRERPPGWQRFDNEVTDPVAGLGPLRGIITALEAAKTERTIILPVDMPLVGKPQLDWLSRQAGGGVLIRRTRPGSQGRIEPMPLLVGRAALPTIRSRLAQERRSVHGLESESSFSIIDAPVDWDDRVWTNLNEPADLALALTRVKGLMRADR